MYQKVSLPLDPSIARRLIDFEKVGGLTVSDELRKLAEQTDYNLEDLNEFKDVYGDVVQFISDRKGRCILIENRHKLLRSTLMYVALNNKLPLLIAVPNHAHDEKFIAMIKEFLPDASISTDPNYDESIDVYIATPEEVYIREGLAKRVRFAQVILTSGIHMKNTVFGTPDSINGKFAMIAKENYSTIFLFDKIFLNKHVYTLKFLFELHTLASTLLIPGSKYRHNNEFSVSAISLVLDKLHVQGMTYLKYKLEKTGYTLEDPRLYYPIFNIYFKD